MVKSIYSKPGTASFLGRIDYDGENWQRRGGRFTPQLMDSLIHCAFALPGTETGRVWLNGGFEVRSVYIMRGIVGIITKKYSVLFDHTHVSTARPLISYVSQPRRTFIFTFNVQLKMKSLV